MKRSLFLLLLLFLITLLLGACAGGGGPTNEVVGTWGQSSWNQVRWGE